MFSLKRISKIFLSILCMLCCACSLSLAFAEGEDQCVIARSSFSDTKCWKVTQSAENQWVMNYYNRAGAPSQYGVIFWREGEKLYAQPTQGVNMFCVDMYPAPDSEEVIEFSCHELRTRKGGKIDPVEVCYGQWFEPKVKDLPGVHFKFKRMLGICVNPRHVCTEHVVHRKDYERRLKFGWFLSDKGANQGGYVTRDFEEGSPGVRAIGYHDAYYVNNIKLPDDVLWAALCTLPESGTDLVSWGL